MATDVECITEDGLLFKDGHSEKFDSIVLATGYRSNVLDWLKVNIYNIRDEIFMQNCLFLHD